MAVRRRLGSPTFFRLLHPGITGWAQANGRNALGWDDKFRLDAGLVGPG